MVSRDPRRADTPLHGAAAAAVATIMRGTTPRRRRGASRLLRGALLVGRLAAPAAAAGFCGTDWGDANDRCWSSCRVDGDCATPGHTCHEYTACVLAEDGGGGGSGGGGSGGGSGAVADDSACGASWIAAMTSCAVPCPKRTECPRGQSCHLATGCAQPMDPIQTRQVMSMTGDFDEGSAMDAGQRDVFSGAIFDHLGTSLARDKVSINSAEVTGQTTKSKSRYRYRGLRSGNNATADADAGTGMPGGVDLELAWGRATRRRARSAAALDVSMMVKGECLSNTTSYCFLFFKYPAQPQTSLY